MKTVSLVMIAKNEARCIARCLNSAKEYVDEMIVVDTGSTDATAKIAEECGAKVFHYEWQDDFAKARNFALSKATSDWNLVLDADEYIKSVDRNGLQGFLENEKQLGNIKIINFLDREDDKNISKAYISRLLPKGVQYTRSIHEQPDTELMDYPVAIEVYHDGYIDQDNKTKRNLRYLKQQVKNTGGDSYVFYQLGYTLFLNKEYKEADKYFERFYSTVKNNSYYRNAGIIAWIENATMLGNFNRMHKIIEQEEVNLQFSSEFYFICAAFYREYVFSDIEKNIGFLPYVEQCYEECLKIGENEKENGAIGTGTYLAAYNLGAWYEAMKQYDKAMSYYKLAEKWQYKKASERIKILQGH